MIDNKDITVIQESFVPKCLKALKNLAKSIKEADIRNISFETQTSVVDAIGGIFRAIGGTSGIANIKKKAEIVYDRYSKMIDSYEKCEGTSLDLIDQFSAIRDDINAMYQEYIDKIKDIFGEDAVRSIAPDIFDFGSVEYLDIYAMLDRVKLKYEELQYSCGMLLESIGESFCSTAGKLISTGTNARKSGDYVGAVFTGVSAVASHYHDAAVKTDYVEKEFIDLKNMMAHDAKNIQADQMRLAVIIKNINDLFIPQANSFYINAENVMSEDLEEIIDSAYSTDELQQLREKRENCYELDKSYNRFIADFDRDCSNNLSGLVKNNYLYGWKKAVRRRIFLHIWDLGAVIFIIGLFLLPNFFGLNAILWKVIMGVSGGVILLIRILRNINWREYWGYVWKLQKVIYLQEENSNEIKEINKEIRGKLYADESIKSKVADHLSSLIKVLKVGKSVLENKIDDKLLNPVKFPEIQNISLSPKASRGIESLNKIKNSVINSITRKKGATKDIELPNNNIERQGSNTKVKVVTAIAEIISSKIELQDSRQQGLMAEEKYNLAMKKLNRQFKWKLKEIDNQADVLNEALKNVNLARNHDDLVQALSELSQGDGVEITKSDIEDMLAGKKTITI